MNPNQTAQNPNPANSAVSTGINFDPAGEIQQLKEMAEAAPIPAAMKDKVDKMLIRLSRMVQMGNFTTEYEPVEQYIKWIIQIPWGKYSQDNLDLKNAYEELNKYHFGLDMVKDKVVDYLAVLKLQVEGPPDPSKIQQLQQSAPVVNLLPSNSAVKAVQPPVVTPQAPVSPEAQSVMPSPVASTPAVPAAQPAPVVVAEPQNNPAPSPTTQPAEVKSNQPTPDMSSQMSKLQGSAAHAPVMCFVGIQGVGKTSIAKSIANALGRKFVRVALGAMGDVSQIRGIPKGQMNAEPGQIIKGLIRAGTMNPLILLDEIDKTSSESGLRADLMAALLEILDPEQNATFVDHYIDHPIDLSQCMFITTSNNLGGLSAALLDRLEIIRFGSYTDEDKVNIARNYMLPRVREATGITEQQLSFDDDVWSDVVRPLGFDAGVRELERTLTTLARKVARKIVEGQGTSFRVTKQNFNEYIPKDIGVYS